MTHGVVAAGSAAAAEAGVEILRAGGNATDAAIGGMFVAFQSEPLIASVAGGGVLLAGNPRSGFGCLEFIPAMPGLGGGARGVLDFEPITIDFGGASQVFHVGRGAAAVPMGVRGLFEAHGRWGRIPFRDVVEPAVRMARQGAPVTAMGAKLIDLIQPIWRRSPECARLYTIAGRPAARGDRLVNPELADALVALAESGPRSFHEGPVADAIVRTFGHADGGLITHEDLARSRPVFRNPLRVPMWGGDLLTAPPRSSGGVLIALPLAALSRHRFSPEEFLNERHLRAILEAEMLALEARSQADPDGTFAAATVERLLSEDGIAAAADRIGRVPAGPAVDPGRGSKGGTTHVSALDEEGNGASLTMSYGEGCGHVIPGTGIVMNNFLGEEDINPRGFHALPPGTTLTTMMAPTMFVRGDRIVLVVGSGGANRLRTAILQVLFNWAGFGRSLEASIGAPRVHAEHRVLFAEPFGSAAPEIERWAERFAELRTFSGPNLFFGGVNAVGLGDEGFVGCGDPRRMGACATC
jgi:gamma-glutamyltranspeptidase/glutathione hydrolase